MGVCDGNVADVAGGEVEGLGRGWGRVDGYAGGALEEVVPFVAGGVPTGEGERGMRVSQTS